MDLEDGGDSPWGGMLLSRNMFCQNTDTSSADVPSQAQSHAGLPQGGEAAAFEGMNELPISKLLPVSDMP